MLLSSEWISAAEATDMGLVWKLTEPDDLLPEARRHAEVLAAKPISSLVACKRVITEPLRDEIAAARERENQCFIDLMGGPGQQRGAGRLRRRSRARLHQPAARLVIRRQGAEEPGRLAEPATVSGQHGSQGVHQHDDGGQEHGW
jgi:enoyl-CoA hydratase/carnithine racemase